MYFSFRDNDMNNQCSYNNYAAPSRAPFSSNQFPSDQFQSSSVSPTLSFGQPAAYNDASGFSQYAAPDNYQQSNYQQSNYQQSNVADFFNNNLQQADAYNNMFLRPNENRPVATNENVLQNNVLRITRELGTGPSMMDNSSDGCAIWKYSTMIKGGSIWCRVFNKIEVCAEKKFIKTPKSHMGYVTTTTKVKLDGELIRGLQKELQQISYCPATKNLRITSDSLEHCLSVLALVCSCQQQKISVGKVKYYNLANKYFRLTTPGDKKYCSGAKYALIKFIQS